MVECIMETHQLEEPTCVCGSKLYFVEYSNSFVTELCFYFKCDSLFRVVTKENYKNYVKFSSSTRLSCSNYARLAGITTLHEYNIYDKYPVLEFTTEEIEYYVKTYKKTSG